MSRRLHPCQVCGCPTRHDRPTKCSHCRRGGRCHVRIPLTDEERAVERLKAALQPVEAKVTRQLTDRAAGMIADLVENDRRLRS